MKKVLCLMLCLVLCLGLAACKDQKAKPATGDTAVHTICVLGENDTPLANVGVFVYEDQSQKELVWYEVTDENGKMTFEDVQRDTYVAVLSEVPVGYAVEESYPLTGLETTIRLQTGTMTEDMDITYQLGDLVMDFTVTDTEGNEWSLKELLQTKKAVVLNFYYNGCVPCQMEFPHLQEAYLDYADQVAVIAMNPVDNNDAVAAFKAEHGLTFPMASVSNKWEQFMQISAYPKTVVIDRLGNIVLMHTGSVDSAQTFRDVFAAVSAEEYEQVIYESIGEVPVSALKGTIDNPAMMGATQKFEVTVEAGKEYYVEFLRLNNMTMRIADPDAYVLYNGKKYEPKNGVVSLIVDSPDTNTAVLIGFGNSSSQTKTFTVTMAAQPGSIDNPYSLQLGDVTVKVSAGNDQGVYYTWTATENGSLQAWCTSATSGVKYDCTLYNLVSYAQRSLSLDSQNGELGRQYVEVLVNKGDKVQMIAAVLPDDTWNYPGGTFHYMVEFVPGPGRDKDKVENTTYTIKVTDEEQNPLANVNFQTTVNDTATALATDAEGIVKADLPTGEYKFTMIIPEGYLSEVTEFTLTKEAPEYTLVLTKKVVVMADYTVTITDPFGEPVVGATVIIGDRFDVSDENGQVTMNLEEGEYTVQVMAPEGYVIPQDSYSFPEGETALLVDAEYIPGSEKNPIDLTNALLYEGNFVTTVTVPAGQTLYYDIYRAGGMEMTINGGESVVCGGSMMYPHTFTITNDGAADAEYTIVIGFPVGSSMNPVILESLGQLETSLQEGDDDGFYYSWTAQEEGFITFYIASITEGVEGDIVLVNNVNSTVRSLVEDGEGGLVTLNVAAGDEVSIQILTVADDMGGNLTAQIISMGSFTAQTNEAAKLNYSILVTDENNIPMENVKVTIGNTELITDADGMAVAELVEGTYTATIEIPNGYKAAQTQYTLTVLEPQTTAVVTKRQQIDYEIYVTYNGYEYMDTVYVQLWQDDTMVFEEEAFFGMAWPSLLEGEYTVKLVLADATMAYDQSVAKVTAENPVLTIELQKLEIKTDYTVTVLDSQDQPVSGVLVQIMKGTSVMSNGTTDADGCYAQTLNTGNYTVKLTFSGTKHYYNQGIAVLTGTEPNLVIRLATEVDEENVISHHIVKDNNMYVLGLGTTHVQIGAGKPYVHTGSNYTDCLFVFVPEELGVYSISVDIAGLEIRSYGTIVGNLLHQSSEYEDGTLHYEIKEASQLGNEYLIFGVQNKTSVSDICVTITRIGEPGKSMENVPIDDSWYSGYVPTKQATPAGTANYVDIQAASGTYEIFFDEADQVYKVMVNGVAKTLYINLGTVTTQNISLNVVLNGNGTAGGSALRKFILDSDGNIIAKEDYTDLVNTYISCADSTYGVYAMTKDLAYIVQNAKPGWWDASSPDYLLTGANPEYGWLFAACYFG